MTSLWFLIIVFFTPSGHAYLERDMLPRLAPSEMACMNKAAKVRAIHAEVQAVNPLLDDAEVFCWKAMDVPELQNRLREEFPFVEGWGS